MKYILLLCAGLLAMQGISAQHTLDVLYFKNGSVIRGRVFSNSFGVIKIENRIKDTLVFNGDEIDSIRQEAITHPVAKKGFYNIDEGGFQFSDSKGSMWRVIGGYRVAHQWQAGIGIGLDDYQARSVPVFGDVRYSFNKEEVSCFLFGGAGIAFPWLTRKQWQQESTKEPDKNGVGAYAHAGVGYKFGTCHFSLGWAHTGYSVQYEMIDWQTQRPLGRYTKTDYSFNRITIMFGVTL